MHLLLKILFPLHPSTPSQGLQLKLTVGGVWLVSPLCLPSVLGSSRHQQRGRDVKAAQTSLAYTEGRHLKWALQEALWLSGAWGPLLILLLQ